MLGSLKDLGYIGTESGKRLCSIIFMIMMCPLSFPNLFRYLLLLINGILERRYCLLASHTDSYSPNYFTSLLIEARE
jgi:hypothetical protein